MFCSVYAIGGISPQVCKNAITDGVEACVLCDGHGREPYPDPTPMCKCGRPGNHSGTCAERQSFFDAHRTPTEGEKEFIANLILGQAPSTALENSSLATTSNPDRKADRLMQLPHIKKYLHGVLERAGATDDKIAQVIFEGLDASDLQIRTERRTEKGKKIEEVKTFLKPDWPSRLRAAELALRAKGFMERDDGRQATPTKVTIVNKFSKRAQEDEGQVIEVESAG